MAKRGMMVVLEGMVGCGKTTQLKAITDELVLRGISYFSGREPGGVHVAEKIRRVLLDSDSKGMNPLTEVLLFEAARAEYFSKVVIPCIQNGEVIITDRSYFSTLAFQGYGHGVDLDLIRYYNRDAVFGHHPDITFVFDVECVEDAVRRAGRASSVVGEADRFEEEELAFHTRVRDGYRAIVQGEKAAREIYLIPSYETEPNIPERISKITQEVLAKLIPFLEKNS